MNTETITRTRLPNGTYRVEGTRQNGIAECPDCGAEIPMLEDVVEYIIATGKVTAWGPGEGVCGNCHLLIVDDMYSERALVFDLRPAATAKESEVVNGTHR